MQTTLAQSKEVYKDEVSLLVEDAIGKLDKVDAQAKDQKRQIVVDLAKSLEGKIPTDTICMNMVDQLHGRVSERFIRECLEEKYKQKIRVDNARKQKRQPESIVDNNLAVIPPLNAVVETDEITILELDDPMPPSNNDDEDKKSTTSVIDASTADISIVESSYQLQEQEKLKYQNNSKINECSSCKDLYYKNLELEEALEKSNQMITADKLASVDTYGIVEDTDNQILRFEFPIKFDDVRRNMAILIPNTGINGNIWFCGEINKNTGKVVSSRIGRLSQ